DSYVKWGATMLDRMPADWQRSLVVIRTPALPSTAQLGAALAGTRFTVADTKVVDLDDLGAILGTQEPDVVLLSVRGPVVRVLVRQVVATAQRRPVIVGGLPGISIPETLGALYYRSQVDLFVLHSKREVRVFGELADHLGIEQKFALAALPFLSARHPGARQGTDIVFAPQVKVPKSLEARTQLLGWLVEAARRHPERRVVIKLRGMVGEAQTHSERYPYDVLLQHVDDAPDNLVLSTGSMTEHLHDAGALVTVSSTAALEAIAAGVPVLAIDDFGVTARLINLVFEDSGLLAGSSALIDADFREPSEHWLDDNYFHAPSDETWIHLIEEAVARREAGELPLRRQFRGSLGGNLRRVWDRKRALGKYDRTVGGFVALAVGLPLRGAVRRLRKLRAKLRRSTEPVEQELVRVP
ncbi:MAG: DUF6716 putative glycosyltransferase, partial [Pseudolysinimonas sp.]